MPRCVLLFVKAMEEGALLLAALIRSGSRRKTRPSGLNVRPPSLLAARRNLRLVNRHANGIASFAKPAMPFAKPIVFLC